MDAQRLSLLKRKLEALNYDGELDTKSAPLAEKVRPRASPGGTIGDAPTGSGGARRNFKSEPTRAAHRGALARSHDPRTVAASSSTDDAHRRIDADPVPVFPVPPPCPFYLAPAARG
jgi:hypothetical protein